MSDEVFMHRALELARRPPCTSPNPRVGAVVVRDGVVISEASHLGAGTAHAEAAALAGVNARGVTVYVNLEPCNHHGQMPPCAPALADAGVTRVVAALVDPDDRVRGSGFDYLRRRGVEVTVGVLAEEAAWLNAPFLHHRTTGRAFVSLKLALTLDGRMAAADGSSRWITGEATRQEVHRRRLEADAVLVGSGTVLADDPSLTVRAIDAPRQPLVLVVDASGRIPPTARIFQRGGVIVATSLTAPHERQLEWKEAGAEVVPLPAGADGVDLDGLIVEAGRRGMTEILCEGGAGLATQLLRRRLVDRLELHHGALMTGAGPTIGDLGVTTIGEAPRFELIETRRSENDVIAVYRKTP
ncbi:MAG: bifunctional diaminohydroxyphosphoribosylaminopyrimidine deaminase/5-amino-6-(5-phosphoribosylamino)uracil reductase RibD [Actinomycetota bacterium]|nr:bifunctional diaminohydroxyphosphoribosylaminopyrimidine deaminase/5-amino-6-(5-phosphoribosylamino)uracil reductase RibD [Actinomycetota bacterium]